MMSEDEIFLQQIGQRIMERRKKLGLTQEALAEKGDKTQTVLSYHLFPQETWTDAGSTCGKR